MTPQRLANLREHLESRAKAGDFYITHNQAVLDFLSEIERLTGRTGRAEQACQALLAALEPINFDSNWPRLIDDLEAAMRQAAGLHEGRVAP